MIAPEIAALLVRYCDAMDAADWATVGELFVEGRLLGDDGSELARGRDGVAAFFERLVILHGGSPQTKHLVLNTVIEAEAKDEVAARSTYLVLQATEGRLEPVACGTYNDRFVRGQDEWSFTERRFRVDLAGDLTRHVRGW